MPLIYNQVPFTQTYLVYKLEHQQRLFINTFCLCKQFLLVGKEVTGETPTHPLEEGGPGSSTPPDFWALRILPV